MMEKECFECRLLMMLMLLLKMMLLLPPPPPPRDAAVRVPSLVST
jgi:hypothetical protein